MSTKEPQSTNGLCISVLCGLAENSVGQTNLALTDDVTSWNGKCGVLPGWHISAGVLEEGKI